MQSDAKYEWNQSRFWISFAESMRSLWRVYCNRSIPCSNFCETDRLVNCVTADALAGCTWQVPWTGAGWHALWPRPSVHWESGAHTVSSLSSHHRTHLAAYRQGVTTCLCFTIVSTAHFICGRLQNFAFFCLFYGFITVIL